MSIDFRDTIKLSSSSFKFNVNSRLFRKSKGSKTIESENWKIEVCWDLSAARYLSGPEPVDGYHIVVMVDSELGLVLGDLAAKATDKKMNNNNFSSNHVAKVSLVARKEHCSGSTLYVTKAKFCESGSEHDKRLNRSHKRKSCRGLFPDLFSLSRLMKSYSKIGGTAYGFGVLGLVLKLGYTMNNIGISSLMHALCNELRINDAALLFQKMETHLGLPNRADK